MPKRNIPNYRLHKSTGQAFVELSGRRFYLGKHGSKASREEYERRIADSPKVMLAHYKRVSEDKFRQVSQYQPRQYCPKNDGGKVDGQKTPDFSVSPIESRINPPKKLTGILTGNSPESHGIGGNCMETGQSPMLSHVLENKVREGINRQEMVQCGNAKKCNNGEDRICRARRKVLNGTWLRQFSKTISSKVPAGVSASIIPYEDVLSLFTASWHCLPLQTRETILRLILQHASLYAR